MKRSFLYLAAGALALSACTSENVLEDAAKKNNAISFENVVNKHTRADIIANNLKAFNVYGYYLPSGGSQAISVFEDTKVAHEDLKGWVCSKTEFWYPDAKYYFYAYNCGNEETLDPSNGKVSLDVNGTTPEDRVLKISNYVCDDSHQHDLIYASNTGATETDPFAGILGQTSGNAPVAFQFNHLLSKVQAKFSTTLPEGYTVEISDVYFESLYNVADYNPNNGWSNQRIKNGNRSYAHILKNEDAINMIETSNGGQPAMTNAAYVIPCTYTAEDTEVYFRFNITVKNKNQVVFSRQVSTAVRPDWALGYCYTYNVVVSPEATDLNPISFTTSVSVSDWVNWVDEEGKEPVITID